MIECNNTLIVIYKAVTQTNTEIVRRDPWESYLFLLTGFSLLGFFSLVKYLGIILCLLSFDSLCLFFRKLTLIVIESFNINFSRIFV